jgi:hypothetical protein
MAAYRRRNGSVMKISSKWRQWPGGIMKTQWKWKSYWKEIFN